MTDRGVADLNVIAVTPEHQRKGVGKMLVTWGIEKARQDSRDIYLASMPAGRSLYLSCGFRELGEMEVFGITQYHMLLGISNRI
jgi:GNAT superfamily N-acetyltransferase